MKITSLVHLGVMAVLSMGTYAHAAGNPLVIVKLAGDSNDGRCEPTGTSNRCNLRAAIAFAQQYQGTVTVRLDTDPVISLGPIEVNPANPGFVLNVEGNYGGIIRGPVASSGGILKIGKNASVNLHRVSIKDFKLGYNTSLVDNEGSLTLDYVTFDNNTLSCSAQGILSANALCYSPVAINNRGTLTLRNAHFSNNKATASAFNAATSYSSSSFGAVSSTGKLIFDGQVSFTHNTSRAEAHSVPRSGAPTSASASASSGALAVSGQFEITAQGKNKCSFQNNAAEAVASDPSNNVTTRSNGGAVILTDVRLSAPLTETCSFEGNSAQTNPDVAGTFTIENPQPPVTGGIRTDIDYLIVSRHSGKCLDVKDFNTENLALTQQWECFGGSNQRFRFVDEGNGYFSIVSRLSNRCVSAQAVSYDDGTPAVLWDCHSGPDQKVKPLAVEDGLFEFRFSHSNKCLDIDGPTDANGAKGQQWECFGSNNQKWMLRPAD